MEATDGIPTSSYIVLSSVPAACLSLSDTVFQDAEALEQALKSDPQDNSAQLEESKLI